MNVSPQRGARIRRAHQLCALAFLAPSLAFACSYPDEGTAPLRRALTKVQSLPETESWLRERKAAGEPVQFRLLLDKEAYFNRKCHWTVEAVAKDGVWRRFYVSPDGESVLIDYATSEPPATEPPRPRRAPAPKAARP